MQLLRVSLPLCRALFRHLLVPAWTLGSLPIQAADVHGRVQVGAYQVRARFAEPVSGSRSNDQMTAPTRMKLQVDRLNTRYDGLTLELRDKFDLFGKRNPELLQLDPANTLELRQLAYHRPFERNRIYFSLGRIELPHAGIQRHDGVEAGYRLTRGWRLGAFVGLGEAHPEVSQLTGSDPRVDEESGEEQSGEEQSGEEQSGEEQQPTGARNRLQGGAYFVYDARNVLLFDSVYLANAIGKMPNHPSIFLSTNRVFIHHYAMLSFATIHRIHTFLDLDIDPVLAARRFRFSYGLYKRSFRARAYVYQVDPEDYILNREINDLVAPSRLRTLGTDLQVRLTDTFGLKLQGSLSTRLLDKLTRQELVGGPIVTVGSLSLSLASGMRENYLSKKGSIIKGSANYYNQHVNLHVSQSFAHETEEITGSKRDPAISTVQADFYLSGSVRGGIGLTYLKEARQTITSALALMAMTFGERATPPVRTETPAFEEL